MKYVGSATSAFQADPLWSFRQGRASSDWDIQVYRNHRGQSSRIRGKLEDRQVPELFRNRDLYLKRSAELGENMFRVSFEMARICPMYGGFNETHMRQNIRLVAAIRAFGEEPMVTLNHFTMPAYLAWADTDGSMYAGAWEHPDAVPMVTRYFQGIAKFFSDPDRMKMALECDPLTKPFVDEAIGNGLVRYFMTVNEPWTVLGNGYLFGTFPPFRKGRLNRFRKVLHKMVAAHDAAIDIFREMGEKMKLPADRRPLLGAGYNWNYLDGPLGPLFHRIVDCGITDAFERQGDRSDFLGLQYYFRKTLPFGKGDRDYGDHPNFGDIYPEGIGHVLRAMHARYQGKPIFVTEMGFADHGDERRPYWLLETVNQVLGAVRDGVPVEGVLLWSLVANMEWEQGMRCNFGLFEEKELARPLPAPSRKLRSWEAWRGAIKVLRDPSPSIGEFKLLRDRALQQYRSFNER